VCRDRDFRPISRFISKMMEVRTIVTMEGDYEAVQKFSNGAISNDPEWPLTYISRSQYYSTLNNSIMVEYGAIFTMADR